MTGLLKAEHDALGATADPVHFDSTIARTVKQLGRAAQIAVEWEQDVGLDTLVLDVEVQNLAGHKLPTGFPSRGMWLEVLVTDGVGAVRFHSGGFDPATGEIDELDEDIEPHYDTIRDDDQVQVYQSVMVDDFSASPRPPCSGGPPTGRTTASPRRDTAWTGRIRGLRHR